MTCDLPPVRIENWRYIMDMGCMLDIWRLYGQVYGHPGYRDGSFICPSTPVHLDEERMLITTASGRVYELGNCNGDVNEHLQYIRDDIANRGSLAV